MLTETVPADDRTEEGINIEAGPDGTRHSGALLRYSCGLRGETVHVDVRKGSNRSAEEIRNHGQVYA